MNKNKTTKIQIEVHSLPKAKDYKYEIMLHSGGHKRYLCHKLYCSTKNRAFLLALITAMNSLETKDFTVETKKTTLIKQLSELRTSKSNTQADKIAKSFLVNFDLWQNIGHRLVKSNKILEKAD